MTTNELKDMEFKELGVKRAKEYVKEVNTKELINYMLPNCDVTVGEACFDDYTSGYNQALIDSKAPEMLKMLNILLHDYKNHIQNISQDSHRNNRINEIEQLIKQATEL